LLGRCQREEAREDELGEMENHVGPGVCSDPEFAPAPEFDSDGRERMEVEFSRRRGVCPVQTPLSWQPLVF
jgi:hypothetical protein